MSFDFFNSGCSESKRTDQEFGICDDQNGDKAYTDVTHQNKWIAKVFNKVGYDVVFTAIDNCIILFKKGTKDKESTCDGMLTFNQSLYLVELKEQDKSWKTKAISQLENTIRLLWENHDLDAIKFKKAYACNKKHPYFETMSMEEKKLFFRKTNGFILDVHTKIVLK